MLVCDAHHLRGHKAAQFDGVIRNRITYKIAATFNQLGYDRPWMQCKNKIVQRYRKVMLDYHQEMDNYSQLHVILHKDQR